MQSRGRGFTLIELLVVIAIIGILAAMLFPVFARARESARKTQCLANVKNIATAINMYLADYDRTWPNETRREVIDYFNGAPGGGDAVAWPEICNMARQANPYLRDAVVLEEYVKSRDVWKCPSAKLMAGAGLIVPMGPNGDWLQLWKDTQGQWGSVGGYAIPGPCDLAFPPGWGGDITDSFVQGAANTQLTSPTGAGAGVFVQGVGINDSLHWQNMSAVEDAGRYISCGDTGAGVLIWNANTLAYPDACHLSFCGGTAGGTGCPAQCVADWENCPDSQNCGFTKDDWDKFFGSPDPSYQKTYTRHMGGSNVGFVDGHAKWFLAQSIMTQSEPFKDPYFQGGLCACWPGNGVMQ